MNKKPVKKSKQVGARRPKVKGQRVAKLKTPKTKYYANVYDMNGQIIVQGNTFNSGVEAANNIYSQFTFLKTVLVYER